MTQHIARQPDTEKPCNGGVQKLYKFANGYGASVVRHSFSYGREQGLWELAVLVIGPDGQKRITYDTPITDDVLGSLDDAEVEALLDEIEALPKSVSS